MNSSEDQCVSSVQTHETASEEKEINVGRNRREPAVPLRRRNILGGKAEKSESEG